MPMPKMIKAFLLSIALLFPVSATAETYLLMAEEEGCYWCARWNKEIAPIYPKTDEGKTATLKRYDLHDDDPGVELARSVHFTPTFILVDNNKEVGRIEGYPGEDFFWGLLTEMMKNANIEIKQTSSIEIKQTSSQND